MSSPNEFIYSAATAIFVFLALAQTLFLPIMGGIGGFSILFLLTVKFIVGKIKEKATTTTKTSVYDTPDGPLTVTQKIPKDMPDLGGSGVGKANIYALIIDYLTTPMSKFEKGMLLLGWALWPILFPLVPIIIIIAIKDNCTVVGGDWCNALLSFF